MDQSSPNTIFVDHDEDPKEVNNNSTMDYYDLLVKQPPLEKDQHDDENSRQAISESSDQIKCSRYPLGGFSNGCDKDDDVDDDNDGFKTPTSLEHKIPTVLQCPPAPRKPRIALNSMKRKAPPRRCRRRLVMPSHLDVSKEVELAFSLFNARKHLRGKIKKAGDVNSDYDLLFSGTTS